MKQPERIACGRPLDENVIVLIERSAGDDWPLIGRERELQQIGDAIEERVSSGLVIAAPAGVGKSRLAREARAAANAAGARTFWVQATASSATIPLGAMHEVIPDNVRSEDPLELVRQCAAALRGLAATGDRVLLVVDDAQLLDPASAALLLGLASSGDVFVVVTVRSGEPVPDAIDALWKDAGGRRMELSPIDDEALSGMVQAGLRGPCAPATLRWFQEACHGNPLYARELVLGALQEQRLVCHDGLWTLSGSPSMPPTLIALITRRIGGADSGSRRVLELLALGEPLRIDELVVLASYELMEQCETRGLITVDGPAGHAAVRLAHPLYGEVVRSELPVLRGRTLRLALAETVGARDPLDPDDALRTVRWMLDAGAEPPLTLLLDAAEAANLAGDPELAETLAERARASDQSLRAALLLARAAVIRNRFRRAEDVLADSEDAAAAAAALGDDRAIAYLSQRLHVLTWGLHDLGSARSLLERAAGWSTAPDWRAHAEPWRLTVTDAIDAAPTVQEIREQRQRPDLPKTLAGSLARAEALTLAGGGRLREALAIARELRPRPPLRDEHDTYDLGVAYYVGQAAGEDWSQLGEYLGDTVTAAERVGDHQAAGFAQMALSELAIHGGRYREAGKRLSAAENHYAAHDALALLGSVYGLQAGVACMTADPAAARIAVQRMRRWMLDRPARVQQLMPLACGEGWAARARGDAAGAAAFLAQAEATNDPNVRARTLHEALRAGAPPVLIAEGLEQLVQDADCVLIEAFAAHASAAARTDATGLLGAAERLAEIGCVAAAIDAAAAATRQFLDEGRRDSARRAASRMRDLHPPDQGWDLPLIDGLDTSALGLTPREAQIAGLAARGLSNQQIADETVLSVRTVETYVYRAMQKRGVDRRQDL